MGLFDFFHSRSLVTALNQTYKIKVHGVKFTVRKINPLDYMTGSKAVTQYFDTYKTEGQKEQELANVNVEKMKQHYSDVILAAVVEPKLVRREEDSDKGIWVGHLFSDWDLANELYLKIMEITYGKKKMKQLTSQKIS